MVSKAMSVRPGSLIRRLGSFEEYIWLLERRISRTIVLLAEVQGSTTPEDWRTALNRVQAHHTILSSRIRKDPGYRPYFELARDVGLPLEVVPLDSGASTLERCSRELGTKFPQGHMLMRATVLHDRDRSTLILAADHAAFDGRSLVFIMRDLLRSLAGESLGNPQPISPSQDELFGLRNPEGYASASAEATDRAFETGAQDSGERFLLERVWIEPPVTSSIALRARREQTTVHGALTAAIMLAGRGQSRQWRDTLIRCASPIDNRATLNAGANPGLLLTFGYTELAPAFSSGFWDLARQVRRDVNVHHTIAEAAPSLAPIREMMSVEQYPDNLVAFSRQRAHTLMVTNYGRLGIPANYGRLQLQSISPFVNSGAPHTQTVSVATLSGLLCMTNVSVEPVASLLEKARNLVISESQ
jgi:hypothetical protein